LDRIVPILTLDRIVSILRALRTAFRRDWKSFGSIGTNTFFPVTLLLLQRAGAFLYLLAGVITIFPMSTDPLRKIPRSRLDLWPLTARDRWLLRALSPWLNPMTWLLAAGAVWAARGRLTIGLWAAVAGLVVVGFAASELPRPRSAGLWRFVPGGYGVLRQLVRKNLREILSTLDFYLALLLSVSAGAWRVFGAPVPAEARVLMTCLIVIALASYSQTLFGMDGEGGLSRYRLLPVSGRQILLSKDIAFLSVVTALGLPLSPLAAITAGLICAAMGHAPSVSERREQLRWRFSGGSSLGFGVVQSIALSGAGAAAVFTGSWVLLVCVGVWAGSLYVYGFRLETALNGPHATTLVPFLKSRGD
jgi:hypothetical protein